MINQSLALFLHQRACCGPVICWIPSKSAAEHLGCRRRCVYNNIDFVITTSFSVREPDDILPGNALSSSSRPCFTSQNVLGNLKGNTDVLGQ